MGEKTANISTSMTVKECADLFRSSPPKLMSGTAKLQGLFAKASGGVFTADFFTPRDTGPFAGLEEDPPTFTAGTFIRNGAAAANPTELHMYVWDRGDQRQVAVVADHGLMTGAVHAKRLVTQLADMFKAQDARALVKFGD